MAPPARWRGLRSAAAALVKPLTLACSAFTFRHVAFHPWLLEEASMEPTFYDGHIVATTLLTRNRIQRGDVVVFKSPYDPSGRVCKRVKGLPGDIRKNRNGLDVLVDPGKMWVEGDNAARTVDSRDYGPVPQGLLEGVVFCQLWPRFQILS